MGDYQTYITKVLYHTVKVENEKKEEISILGKEV